MMAKETLEIKADAYKEIDFTILRRTRQLTQIHLLILYIIMMVSEYQHHMMLFYFCIHCIILCDIVRLHIVFRSQEIKQQTIDKLSFGLVMVTLLHSYLFYTEALIITLLIMSMLVQCLRYRLSLVVKQTKVEKKESSSEYIIAE